MMEEQWTRDIHKKYNLIFENFNLSAKTTKHNLKLIEFY
jgi:hypothetical protein